MNQFLGERPIARIEFSWPGEQIRIILCSLVEQRGRLPQFSFATAVVVQAAFHLPLPFSYPAPRSLKKGRSRNRVIVLWGRLNNLDVINIFIHVLDSKDLKRLLLFTLGVWQYSVPQFWFCSPGRLYIVTIFKRIMRISAILHNTNTSSGDDIYRICVTPLHWWITWHATEPNLCSHSQLLLLRLIGERIFLA